MSTGIAVRENGIALRSMDDLARFAGMVYHSGMGPKGMGPEAIGVAVMMGAELGLSPMQALQSIAVIGGRAGVYGDATLALVRNSGLLETLDEFFEQDGKRLADTPAAFDDGTAAVCVVKRKDVAKPRRVVFSVADAKRACLWGKSGPWSQYPQRMMRFRAQGFALRDEFGDVLRGFKTVEELRDYPTETPAPVPALPPAIQDETPPAVIPDAEVEAPASTVVDPEDCPEIFNRIDELVIALKITPEAFAKRVKDLYGLDSPAALSVDQASELVVKLEARLNQAAAK